MSPPSFESHRRASVSGFFSEFQQQKPNLAYFGSYNIFSNSTNCVINRGKTCLENFKLRIFPKKLTPSSEPYLSKIAQLQQAENTKINLSCMKHIISNIHFSEFQQKKPNATDMLRYKNLLTIAFLKSTNCAHCTVVFRLFRLYQYTCKFLFLKNKYSRSCVSKLPNADEEQ